MMSPERRVIDFRDQATRYRQTATTVHPAVSQRYTDWAHDLELRASAIEAELEAARDSRLKPLVETACGLDREATKAAVPEGKSPKFNSISHTQRTGG